MARSSVSRRHRRQNPLQERGRAVRVFDERTRAGARPRAARCALEKIVIRAAVVGCLAIVANAAVLIGAQMATADRVQGGPGWWPTKGTAPRPDYIGTAACAQCHPAQSQSQSTTAMARTAMRARDSAVLHEHRNL